jgi:hypothetical protein
MAGRPMNKLHQEDVRKKIQAGQLIKVLQDHALTGDSEFLPSRLKAIEILLRKSMPDLTAVTLDGTITHRTLAEELAELNAQRNAEDGSSVA